MTTSKTPLTTDRIRDLYSWACAWRTEDDATEGESDLSGMRTSQRAEFNRWLAAHEAEVVGRILDRIDALHQPVHLVFAWNTGLRRLEPCPTCGGKAGVHECGCWADEDVQYHCDGCTSPDGRHCEPFPCPTRRLTAEIRGEMSHD